MGAMVEQYQHCAGMEARDMDSELMLLDDDTDRIHVLNGSAAFIWALLADPLTRQEIEAKLRMEYDVTPETDLQGLIARALDKLTGAGLITVVTSA